MLYMHNDSNIMVNLKPGLVSDTLVRWFNKKTVLLNKVRLLMSEGEFYFPLRCLDFGAAASADESHIPAEPRKT